MRSLALTAREACAGYRQCSELQVCGHSVFWLAEDPDTGVTGLWQSGPEGTRRLETGPGSVRSCLNGYGGGAYAVVPHGLCWVAENQVLW